MRRFVIGDFYKFMEMKDYFFRTLIDLFRLASLIDIIGTKLGVGKLGWHRNFTGSEREKNVFFLFCATKEKERLVKS